MYELSPVPVYRNVYGRLKSGLSDVLPEAKFQRRRWILYVEIFFENIAQRCLSLIGSFFITIDCVLFSVQVDKLLIKVEWIHLILGIF